MNNVFPVVNGRILPNRIEPFPTMPSFEGFDSPYQPSELSFTCNVDKAFVRKINRLMKSKIPRKKKKALKKRLEMRHITSDDLKLLLGKNVSLKFEEIEE